MQFFTKELWRGLQFPETFEACSQQWDRNLERYWLQLHAVKNRLSPAKQKFFFEVNLHDGKLLAINTRLVHGDNKWINQHTEGGHTMVELIVVDKEETHAYRIHYHGVQVFQVDFPSSEPLFYEASTGIGTWGYDELTPLEKGQWRHEILCSSGGTLLIEFSLFHYQVDPISAN
ncbi:MAG: hypothetical protein AAFR61_22670 [Bacteroidota bacterium]